MNSWMRKARYICTGQEVDAKLNEINQAFAIDFVASKIKTVLKDELYIIEVWLNIDSACYGINMYVTSQEREDFLKQSENN